MRHPASSATPIRLVTTHQEPPEVPGPPATRPHAWLAGVAAFAVVVGVGTWVSYRLQARLPPAPTLLLAPVEAQPVTGLLRSSGSLTAVETRTVTQPLAGQIAQVRARPGDVVKAGQVLARFDSLALRAELARAESRLVAAEAAGFEAEVLLSRLGQEEGAPAAEPEDDQNLADAREVARARVSAAHAEIEARDTAYRLALRQLDQGVVRAPVAGVVVARRVEPGQTVTAGAPLFELASDVDRLLVTTQVPEADMARVRVGLPARFTVPAWPGRAFPATVVALGPLGGPEGARTLPVTLGFDNDERLLAVGMSARVTIEGRGLRPALRVPLAALAFAPRGMSAVPGEPAVWAGDRGALRRISVELGASDGQFVEVRAPRLAAGATVAVGYGGTARRSGP